MFKREEIFKNPYIKYTNRYRTIRGGDKPMTICIASICQLNSGPKIVFASDRLATDEDGLTFELGMAKVYPLNDNCVIMGAGISSHIDSIINKTRRDLFEITNGDVVKLNMLTIEAIVSVAKRRFFEVRKETIQTAIFEPRSMTIESFYQNFKNFDDWFCMMIDSQVTNFPFDVQLLIIGFDLNYKFKTYQPHIYEISPSGEDRCFDSTGFAMIGIGYKQSMSEITKEPYNPNTTISDSIVKTYYSKKSAERMTGVGEYTDLGVMEVILNPKKIIETKITLASEEFKENTLDAYLNEERKRIAEIESEIKGNLEKVFQQALEVPETQKVTPSSSKPKTHPE